LSKEKKRDGEGKLLMIERKKKKGRRGKRESSKEGGFLPYATQKGEINVHDPVRKENHLLAVLLLFV